VEGEKKREGRGGGMGWELLLHSWHGTAPSEGRESELFDGGLVGGWMDDSLSRTVIVILVRID
jgi:hypothetical protein